MCCTETLFWPLTQRWAEPGRTRPTAGARGCEGKQRSSILCPQLPLPGEAGGAGPLFTVVTDLVLDLPPVCSDIARAPQVGHRGWEGRWL